MKKLMMIAAILLAGPAFAEGNTIGGAGFQSLGGGSYSALSTAPKPIAGSPLTYTWSGSPDPYTAPLISTFSWSTLLNNVKTGFGGSLKNGCSSTVCTLSAEHQRLGTGHPKIMLSQKRSMDHGWEMPTSKYQVRPN